MNKFESQHKPVLMIHEIREWMFDLPLENYTLTFDDGLYSQYYYFNRIKDIDTKKYFFISSGIVSNGPQSSIFPDSQTAHRKAFEGNFEDFMTVGQIKEISQDPRVVIGGHGHMHKNLNDLSTLNVKLSYLTEDTYEMIEWFDKNLMVKPTAFCYPYNNDCKGIYSARLKELGFTELFGCERIPIETLLP